MQLCTLAGSRLSIMVLDILLLGMLGGDSRIFHCDSNI